MGSIKAYIGLFMAAGSKAWACGRSLTGIACSNPAGGMAESDVSNVCFQVEVSATGRSLVQRNPSD
jgi:hypothetical protein